MSKEFHHVRRCRGVLAFITPVLWLSAAACAHGAATITVPAELVAEPGENISVPVTAGGATGVLGYYFALSYDPEVLEYQSVSNGALTSAWVAPMVNASPGSVSVANSHQNAVSGSGSLAVLHFQVETGIANGSVSPLTLDAAELNDGAIPTTAQSGQVTVSAIVEVRVPASTGAASGTDFFVPFEVDDAAGVLGFFAEITYDPAIVTYVSTLKGGLTQGWSAPLVNSATAGSIVFVNTDKTALASSSGSLVILRFRFKTSALPGQSTVIHIAAAELNDDKILSTTVDGVAFVSDVAVSHYKYVDFNHTGTELGTKGYPYRSLAGGISAVDAGGTIYIEPGASTETPRITKALRLAAASGTVRIGVSGVKQYIPTAHQEGQEENLEMRALFEAFKTSLSDETLKIIEAESSGVLPENAAARALVQPFTRNADGSIAAAPDSVLSLRLHAGGAIASETLWASLPEDLAGTCDVTWRTADGAMNDLWVRFTPRGVWREGARIALQVGAQHIGGTVVESVEYTFDISAANTAAAPSDDVSLTRLDMDDAPGTVWHIGPEQVFDTPCTVWLPVPEGAVQDSLRAYYYDADNAAHPWWPIEQVSGFLEADTPLKTGIKGAPAFGISLKHAGIIMLRTEQ